MNPRKIIHTLALVFTLAGLALVLSNAAGTFAAGDGTEKIEGTLMDDLVSAGRSDYIIRFNEQADLSAAYSMGWEERGWYVYNTLTETAQRTQTGARAYLDAHGLTYRTFIAGNELYVYGGDLQSATSLGAMPEVLNIRAPRTYTIQPVEADGAVLRAAWAGELLAKGMPATVDEVDAVEWGIVYTNADDFWTAFNVRGQNIRVGNIDTGVRYTHETLRNKYACALSGPHTACWYDPDEIYFEPYDGNGHGTHTMGIMVGSDYYNINQIGMAPNARWIACQGCDGTSCTDADLNACADWMLAPGGNPSNRPHVLNNSWGGTEDGDDWFLVYVNAWRASGIFPAFSAGNNADDVIGVITCNSLGDPGSYQEAFASAAHNSSGLVAAFSSRGPSFFGHEPYTKPNIIGPGVYIRSSFNSYDSAYARMDGTSQASPHSAGAVALLWACNPALIGQVDATFQLLQDTARTPPAAYCGAPSDGEGNYDYGYGYLDVLAAGYATCVATLEGVVTDGTGSPLANVVVTATNQADSTQAQDATGADGRYVLYLDAGVYDVTATLYAYSTGVRTDLSLSTGQIAHVNFTLVYEGGWSMVDPATCFDFWRHDAEYYPGDGNIYILGGRDGPDGTTTYGDIYAFNPVSGNCWDTGDDMPVPVSNYTISLVNDGTDDLLCTFGGRDAAGNPTQAVQCYNPTDGSFADTQDLPSDYSACFPGGQEVVDNQVYIIGGINPAITSPCHYDLTLRYDPVDKTYTTLGILSMPRGNISTAVVDGRIYAFGGDIFDGVTLLPQVRTEVMADPGGEGAWNNNAVAELPTALGAGRAFGFDLDSTFGLAGEVVLVGGGVFPSETAAVFTYNTVTNVYDQSFTDLQEARRNFAAAFVPFSTGDPWDGLPGLYVFGGRQGTDNPPYAPAEYFSLRQVVYTFFPTIIKAEP